MNKEDLDYLIKWGDSLPTKNLDACFAKAFLMGLIFGCKNATLEEVKEELNKMAGYKII